MFVCKEWFLLFVMLKSDLLFLVVGIGVLVGGMMVL